MTVYPVRINGFRASSVPLCIAARVPRICPVSSGRAACAARGRKLARVGCGILRKFTKGIQRFMKKVIALSLCLAIASSASAGVGGDKAAYRAGTVASMKEGFEATANLKRPDAFTFGTLTIPYDKIQSIEYGQEAGRRVGAAIATAVLLSPVGLFMLFSKKRKHMVSLTWTNAEGKTDAAVLEFGKNAIRGALKILEARSGKQIEYESEDARANIGK
jgi:hypothetical protein